MKSRDIALIARQRAGITQRQLADRSGHPRETIARWESGAREPSLASLEALVDSCGLELVIHLAKKDSSLDELVADQLALTPTERLRRLMPSGQRRDTIRTLRWLAKARTPSVVVGDVAAVLQGAAQRPADGHVEIVSGDPFAMAKEMDKAGIKPIDSEDRWADADRREAWVLPKGGTIVIDVDLPGTRGYPDLRRSARTLEVEHRSITVAHPRDLLRVADASAREGERARVPDLRALLRQGRRPGRGV
jgi:transcriptional regulator with XRE-family HTH domain